MSSDIRAPLREKAFKATLKLFHVCSAKSAWRWLRTFEDALQVALMALTLLLAILTVELKNILYAVLTFCGMCTAIGALYWLLNAPYVSVFQLLIYAGAIVTIFLAAIMLTTRKEGMR